MSIERGQVPGKLRPFWSVGDRVQIEDGTGDSWIRVVVDTKEEKGANGKIFRLQSRVEDYRGSGTLPKKARLGGRVIIRKESEGRLVEWLDE